MDRTACEKHLRFIPEQAQPRLRWLLRVFLWRPADCCRCALPGSWQQAWQQRGEPVAGQRHYVQHAMLRRGRQPASARPPCLNALGQLIVYKCRLDTSTTIAAMLGGSSDTLLRNLALSYPLFPQPNYGVTHLTLQARHVAAVLYEHILGRLGCTDL